MRFLLLLIFMTLVGCTDSAEEPIAVVEPPVTTAELPQDDMPGEQDSSSSSSESNENETNQAETNEDETTAEEVEPTIVNAESFQSLVLESDQPVLVDFWAPWCGPCLKLAPAIHELAGEFDGRVTVTKLDIDESPEIAKEYDITGIPALLLFVDGEVVETIVGARPKENIKSTIEEALSE